MDVKIQAVCDLFSCFGSNDIQDLISTCGRLITIKTNFLSKFALCLLNTKLEIYLQSNHDSNSEDLLLQLKHFRVLIFLNV